MDESVVRYFFLQLIEAMHFIEQQGISHRDIKLDNLMVDNKFTLKVIDFGFATEADKF